MTKLKAKTILILGASYGIGEQIAIRLAKQQCKLILSARSDEKLHSIQQQYSNNVIATINCDVCSIEQLQDLYSTIYNQLKIAKIDYIIFCCGVYSPMNMQNFNIVKAQQIIDVNLKGFINFIEVFLNNNQLTIGKLVTISSPSGYFGSFNSLAYGASKAAVTHLMQSLACEYSVKKIRLQVVNPGFVKSRLTNKNSFNMPLLMSADAAAKIIVKNLTSNKFEVVFPKLLIYIMKFLQILPMRLRNFLLRQK